MDKPKNELPSKGKNAGAADIDSDDLGILSTLASSPAIPTAPPSGESENYNPTAIPAAPPSGQSVNYDPTASVSQTESNGKLSSSGTRLRFHGKDIEDVLPKWPLHESTEEAAALYPLVIYSNPGLNGRSSRTPSELETLQEDIEKEDIYSADPDIPETTSDFTLGKDRSETLRKKRRASYSASWAHAGGEEMSALPEEEAASDGDLDESLSEQLLKSADSKLDSCCALLDSILDLPTSAPSTPTVPPVPCTQTAPTLADNQVPLVREREQRVEAKKEY